MRYAHLLFAVAFMVSVGTAQACPDESSTQTKSGTVEKPLAPKPAA